jgi:hypothetical protein
MGLDIQRVSLWICLLIALLLSIGFSILFNRRRRNRWKDNWTYRHAYYDGSNYGADTSESDTSGFATSADANIVRVDVNFGNVIKYINSDHLERVEADCNFGAMKLYFANAKPQASGALVVLDVNFGAAELFIPKEWVVNNDLERAFSGVEDRGAAFSGVEKTARITIIGEANFSSVNIIYI